MDYKIETCGGTPNTFTTPTTKEVIRDTVRISAWVHQTPRHISRTGKYGSTPGDTCIAVRYPRDNSPVMIGGTTVSPACGICGILQFRGKRQSTYPEESGIPKNWTLPLI